MLIYFTLLLSYRLNSLHVTYFGWFEMYSLVIILMSSTGMKHEKQINELSDCNNRDQFAQMLGKNLTSLEGVPVRA